MTDDLILIVQGFRSIQMRRRRQMQQREKRFVLIAHTGTGLDPGFEEFVFGILSSQIYIYLIFYTQFRGPKFLILFI